MAKRSWLLSTTIVMLAVGSAAAAQVQIVEPVDHGRALVNPQMGWTMHFYSNIITNYGSRLAPSDTLDDFPGLSCVYLRVPWGFLEPEEGEFNWSLLDTPAQRWIDVGKQIAIRISSIESWMRWANAGVAPCYPGGFVTFTLKDNQGGIVAAFCDDSFDVRDLKVGPPGSVPTKTLTSTFTVALETYGFAPNTKPGTYDLYVSVGMRDGTPVIALPHEHSDRHRRYKLGQIAVLPRP